MGFFKDLVYSVRDTVNMYQSGEGYKYNSNKQTASNKNNRGFNINNSNRTVSYDDNSIDQDLDNINSFYMNRMYNSMNKAKPHANLKKERQLKPDDLFVVFFGAYNDKYLNVSRNFAYIIRGDSDFLEGVYNNMRSKTNSVYYKIFHNNDDAEKYKNYLYRNIYFFSIYPSKHLITELGTTIMMMHEINEKYKDKDTGMYDMFFTNKQKAEQLRRNLKKQYNLSTWN
jgi:hypothetical protein